MLKVYGITGRTVAIVRVPVGDGKAFLQCEFRRGRMSAGIHNRPATYATTNPVEQDIIENCESFKSGSIKLVRSYGESGGAATSQFLKKIQATPVNDVNVSKSRRPKAAGAPVATTEPEPQEPAPADPGQEPPKEVEVFESVTDKVAAIEILKARGAKATQYATDEGIKKLIKKFGLSFPNLVI
jgi:hypothetical protein